MSTIPVPHSHADALTRLNGPTITARPAAPFDASIATAAENDAEALAAVAPAARLCIAPPPVDASGDDDVAVEAEQQALRDSIADELKILGVPFATVALVRFAMLANELIHEAVIADIERVVPKSTRHSTRELMTGLVGAVREGRYEAIERALERWDETDGCTNCARMVLDDPDEGVGRCKSCRNLRTVDGEVSQ